MYWFVFCKDTLLLTEYEEIPQGEEAPVALEPWHVKIKLPALHGVECCAVQVEQLLGGDGRKVMALRDSFRVLLPEFYAMAGKAAELLYWDATTKFCGVCGGPMNFHTDISKRCCFCGKEVWPQLATAIIVAVTRNHRQEILLVQGRNFRRDYFGLVAGFVETGETLEECVHREVREETGLMIKNVKYWKSQPWPYPSGLMIGFKAEYAGGELKLQKTELSKGGWFCRETLPSIPGKESLARQLIDDWLENGE